jgi:polysaccharide export outer membrane protein
MLLTLSLAGAGCNSTSGGGGLFARRDDGGATSSRFVLYRSGGTPTGTPTGVQGTAVITETGEQMVWRPVQRRNDTPGGSGTGQNVQVVSAQGGPGSPPPTSAAWRSREAPGSLIIDQKGPEKQQGEPEMLPVPTPVPVEGAMPPGMPVGPGVVMTPGMPPPGFGPHPHPVPRELHKMSLPPYTVEPPDILLVESSRGLPTQPVRGQHLVRPDGTINLGIYGSVYVTGMTLEQVKEVVAAAIATRLEKKELAKNPVLAKDVDVDVLAYNSKVYYVITDGGGYGEQVYRIPATGNETVLDAIAQIGGLPAVSSKKHIWVARRVPGHGTHDQVLKVDWCGVAQRGESATNYQIFPGDRVYVKADKLITVDSWIAKFLSPIERVFGATLLGSETVNSIRNRGSSSTGQ